MFGLVIIIGLLIGFYVGGRRGAPFQLLYSGGYLISFFLACLTYKGLAKKLELFIPYPSVTPDSKMVFFDQTESLDLDKAYYAAVAFLIVLFFGAVATHFVAIFFNDLQFKRLVGKEDWLISSALSVLSVYMVIFFVLFVLSMIPLATIQNMFRKSWAARMIVEHTPIISWLFRKLWITSIL